MFCPSGWLFCCLVGSLAGCPLSCGWQEKRATKLWDGQVVMSHHEPGDLHWEHLYAAFLLLIKELCAFFLATECIIQEWQFPVSLSVWQEPSFPSSLQIYSYLGAKSRKRKGIWGFLKSLTEHSFLIFMLPHAQTVQLASLTRKLTDLHKCRENLRQTK